MIFGGAAAGAPRREGAESTARRAAASETRRAGASTATPATPTGSPHITTSKFLVHSSFYLYQKERNERKRRSVLYLT